MWVPPDAFGDPPGYEQRDISNDIVSDELFPLASGAEHIDSAIHINQDDATLWIAPPDRQAARSPFPARRSCTCSCASGTATLEEAGELTTGDAVRITDADDLRVVGDAGGAELVIWAMESELAT